MDVQKRLRSSEGGDSGGLDAGVSDAGIFRGGGGGGGGGLRRGERLLLTATIVAIIGGIVAGIALNPLLSQPSHAEVLTYVGFPGELFLRMLQLMIVPLVISSNVSSAASVSGSHRLAGLSLLYYILTTVAAVLIGTSLTLVIRPGDHLAQHSTRLGLNSAARSLLRDFKADHAIFSAMDLLRNMVPQNPVEATFAQSRTAYTFRRQSDMRDAATGGRGVMSLDEASSAEELFASAINATDAPHNASVADLSKVLSEVEERSDKMMRGANILGLICFSVAFGLGARRLAGPAQAEVRTVLRFFAGLRRIMVYLVSIVIWFSPIGVASLIARRVAQTEELTETARELGWFMLTVSLGLALHAALVLAPLLLFAARQNPLTFVFHMLQAIMIAGGTASSMATLPATANCLEHNLKVNNVVMRFMLPLGTTVNMDGTALFQMVAILYLAQGMGLDLDAGTLLFIMVLVVMSSIATASVPSAGLISMVLTLQAAGLPQDSAKVVMAVDWFLDRLRTPVNVLSNAVGVAVVAHRWPPASAAPEDGCASAETKEETEKAAEPRPSPHREIPRNSMPNICVVRITPPPLDRRGAKEEGQASPLRMPDLLPSGSGGESRSVKLDIAYIDDWDEDGGTLVMRF